MRKRPLCLIWAGLMLVIWILRAAGAPVFGAPRLTREACAMLNGTQVTDETAGAESGRFTERTEYAGLAGNREEPPPRDLPEGGARLQVRGRIRSRKETAASFRYVLKDVQITQVSEIRSDQNSDPDKSDNRNSRSVYFPYLLLTTEKDKICRIGAEVQGTGKVRRIEPAGNPGQFDARRYYACMKLYYTVRCEELAVLEQGGGFREWVSLLRNRLTQNLKILLPEDSAGVLAGMLLGERALLDEEVRRDYQIGGILHILAISGLHISMLGMGLFMLLQYLYLPMPAAAVLSSAFMGVYCLLVGNPSSAVRAIVMFAVSMGAWITKRSYDLLSALSLAGILLLLTNPGYLFLAGFQLSFAAVIGTSAADLLMQELERRWKEYLLERGKLPAEPDHHFQRTGRHLLRSSGNYLLLTLFTMPLTAYYYYEIPVLGLAANLLILPLTGPVLALGAAGCAASLFSMFLAGVTFFPVHLCLRLMNDVLHLMRYVPGNMWICGQPSVLQVFLYYALLACGLIYLYRTLQHGPAGDPVQLGRTLQHGPAGNPVQLDRTLQHGPAGNSVQLDGTLQRSTPGRLTRLHRAMQNGSGGAGFITGCLILVAAICLLMFRPAVPFSFTALDVGQGDGLVVRGGRRTAFLIDGGSTSVDEVGTFRIIPYLKQQGIRRIDGIWISHEDQDHISGILELLQAVSGESLPVSVRALYLPCWMEGTDTADLFLNLCLKAGTAVHFVSRGDTLTAGALRISVRYPLSGTSVSGNEGSMVLQVSYRSFDLLLTGDLEGSGEQELLACEVQGSGEQELLACEVQGSGDPGLLTSGTEGTNPSDFPDCLASLNTIECLKVPHHGSRNASTMEFLELVDPELAVISAGKNNRYGHPHAETLERLTACGVQVFRTDTKGAVTVETDGENVRVRSYR